MEIPTQSYLERLRQNRAEFLALKESTPPLPTLTERGQNVVGGVDARRAKEAIHHGVFSVDV